MIDIRRADDRFETKISWLHARPSFSFAGHWDPDNTHHGLLVVHNEDVIAPSGGFDTHPHDNMEIVTWVLEGELRHRDSMGNVGVIKPGLAQRMSAGTGVLHSEHNASDSNPCHLLQMWVFPDTKGIEPGYEQRDVADRLERGGMFPLASGKHPDAAIKIHQEGATLWVGRLKAGERAALPDAKHVHAFVARGSAELEGAGTLNTSDAARLTAAGTLRVTAGPVGCELIVWETV